MLFDNLEIALRCRSAEEPVDSLVCDFGGIPQEEMDEGVENLRKALSEKFRPGLRLAGGEIAERAKPVHKMVCALCAYRLQGVTAVRQVSTRCFHYFSP